MVTGASTAEVAIVLVDARKGVIEQTRRHAAVAALLGVRHVVLAVNKMDLVDWSEEVFDRIVADFDCFAAKVGLGAVTPLPMSALHGDNVVESSSRLGWYAGPPLLEHLETVELPAGEPGELRFPVQWVLRDLAGGGRAYAGRVAGGELRPGAEVVALPAGLRARVTAVETLSGPLEAAPVGQSVSVRIDRELDLGRGDMLVAAESAPVPDPLARRRRLLAHGGAAAPRRAAGPEARHRDRAGGRGRGRRPARPHDLRARARARRPRAQRHRPGAPARLAPTAGRALRRQPRHRRVRPHRRGTNDTVGAGMIAG